MLRAEEGNLLMHCFESDCIELSLEAEMSNDMFEFQVL